MLPPITIAHRLPIEITCIGIGLFSCVVELYLVGGVNISFTVYILNYSMVSSSKKKRGQNSDSEESESEKYEDSESEQSGMMLT